jgi:hypothetical protein
MQKFYMGKKMGRQDYLFLGALLILGVALTLGIYCFSKTGSRIVVTVDGSTYGVYELDEPRRIEITLDGRVANLLVVKDDTAYMESADCPDELCVHQGAISKSGQTIVCLPHRLVVEVTGGKEADYDTISE